MSKDRDIHEQLTKYLTDAHAIEIMSLQQLKKAPDVADEPAFAPAVASRTCAGASRRG